MEETRQYMVPSRFRAIQINEEICSGCNRCVDICPMDVLAPNQEKGKPPVVTYPEECWFCGCCIDTCPVKDKGAVRVIIPLPMRVSAVRGRRP
ncbi:MAG: 4Fe-4S dicluster domain-containing protein [Desulfatiglandales bacterium]